jgi:N-acetylglucosaminyldiphosphoundecaprenol N-acetyl-beta-D-mannosaminyltransferase
MVEERERVDLLGCEIDPLTMDETVARCDELIREGGFAQHMAINAAKLVSLQDDERLREIVNRCELINADGQSVVWASKLLGSPLPERVAGIDLMHRLFGLAADSGYPVYILGARREVLDTAVARLRAQYPGLDIAGHRDGYFSDDETEAVCADIRASGARILFVAMSSPRKEYFLGEHGRGLDVPLIMGVGGSIDVVAGVTRRAGIVWQRLGLEWLYRLLQEPRRMFKRYARTNGRFIWLVAYAMVQRRPRPSSQQARV